MASLLERTNAEDMEHPVVLAATASWRVAVVVGVVVGGDPPSSQEGLIVVSLFGIPRPQQMQERAVRPR